MAGPPGNGRFSSIARFFGFFPGGGFFRVDSDSAFAAYFLAVNDFSDSIFIRLQHDKPSHTGTYEIIGNQLFINLHRGTIIDGHVHDSDTVEIGRVVYKRV
jgi:hypothetical protein